MLFPNWGLVDVRLITNIVIQQKKNQNITITWETSSKKKQNFWEKILNKPLEFKVKTHSYIAENNSVFLYNNKFKTKYRGSYYRNFLEDVYRCHNMGIMKKNKLYQGEQLYVDY